MFVVKSNEEIGLNLKELILGRYKSVRQFCLAYLKLSSGSNADDPQEIRNTTNRFSQILNGKKAIQTYDLPIVSELLGVSCEDILSCGETKVPLNNRRTNYNIAFSTNKADWEEYLAREDCIAAYADEFGKTVLDYAIEFKNYEFIKYLISKGYIKLVSENPGWSDSINFGAETTISERPYEHPTIKEEFYNNKLLRTQILALALEHDDISALRTFKARELPPQLGVNLISSNISFSNYFDERFLSAIALCSSKVFDFFLEEYPLKVNDGRDEITWIYPFIGELMVQCIKYNEKSKAIKALNAIVAHNKKAYEELHKRFLFAAKKVKDTLYIRSYQDALDYVAREYSINKEKNFVVFHPYCINELEPLAFNIIHVDCTCKEDTVRTKIDQANSYYNNILTLPYNLIKNN